VKRRLALCAALGLSAGCATTAAPTDPDAAASQDALVAGRMDANGLPPVVDATPLPPRDGGPPRADAAPPGGCVPGQPTGRLCEVCGENGRPALADDDVNCPPLDCSALDAYVLIEDEGIAVCTKDVHRQPPQRCIALGSCHQAANVTACGQPTRVEIDRAEGPCQSFDGCVGGTPGTVTDAPVGTPCPGGVCAAEGVCDTEAVDRCGGFAGEAPVCGAGRHESDGRLYCQIAVEGGENCSAACGARGSFCLRAWTSGVSACVPGDAVGCPAAAPALVCRCAEPT
jgi:hypothetical protein